jgi:NADPH-dependent ferric siderophore reductase
VWTATEAITVRHIRRHLLEERGLPVESIVTRGYWCQSMANYRD